MGGGSLPFDVKVELPFVNDAEFVKPVCPRVQVMINHGWSMLFADSAITTEKLESSASTLIHKHRNFMSSYLKEWVQDLELMRKQFNDEKEGQDAEIEGNEVTEEAALMTQNQPDLTPHYVSSASTEGWDEQFEHLFDQDSEFDSSSDDDEIRSLSLIFELDFIQNYQKIKATTNDQIVENKMIASFNQEKLEGLKKKMDMEFLVSFRGLKFEIQKSLRNIERQLKSEDVINDLQINALFLECKDENLKLKEKVFQQLEIIDGHYNDIELFGKFF